MTPQCLAIAIALVSPAILFLAILSMMNRWRVVGVLRRGVVLLTFLVSWIIVLLFAFSAQSFHARDWMREHKHEPLTEEDMVALGDYPNVLATCILFGWIPVLIGYFVAKIFIRSPKKLVEQVEASDR